MSLMTLLCFSIFLLFQSLPLALFAFHPLLAGSAIIRCVGRIKLTAQLWEPGKARGGLLSQVLSENFDWAPTVSLGSSSYFLALEEGLGIPGKVA